MGRILIKFGGGVITEKSSGEPEIKMDVVSALVNSTVDLIRLGHEVIVVHGAGSFGHVLAKRWDLSAGMQSEEWKDKLFEAQRLEAVDIVRKNMDDLCRSITSQFSQCLQDVANTHDTIQVAKHSPREFLKNTGYDFEGDLTRFYNVDEVFDNSIHITHGDLVDCDEPRGFGILSGDHIMYRLATELPDVTHCIFAMDELGILSSPGDSGQLINRWNRDMGLNGLHDNEIDVTGGIFLKVDVAAAIADSVDHVWFIDGKSPERILEIVENRDTIGTRIIPS